MYVCFVLKWLLLVCMYVYKYACVYGCMYVFINACMYVRIHVVYIAVCMHVFMYALTE